MNDVDPWDAEMLTAAERQAVERAVRAIVDQDTEALAAMGAAPSENSDIYMWTRNYGGHDELHLIWPPDLRSSSSVVFRDGGVVGVNVDMWAREIPDRTDLTLELELTEQDDGSFAPAIEDLHVL
jgi:hypothetical protein